MEIYCSSNTKFLDFRPLVCPSDLKVQELCEAILEDTDIKQLEALSHFVLFAKAREGRFFVGAIFDVNKIEEMSSRYFYADRCEGKTPTKATIIYITNTEDDIVFVTKNLIAQVLRKIFAWAWYDGQYKPARNEILSISQDITEYCPKRYYFKQKKFKNTDEMIYKFNSELYYKHPKNCNIVCYLENEEDYNTRIRTDILT